MGHLRILVFSATFGAGHVRAAEALIEAVLNKEPLAVIDHVDFGAFLSKAFNKVLKETYIDLIKYTPKLWGKFYYRTSRIPPDSVFQRFLNHLGRRELIKYIDKFNPDMIICTYPTVAGVLAELRLKKELNVPVITVVTDFAVHSQWIHPGVDLYIVGCKNVLNGLVRRGIREDRIVVTGIPVSPKFEKPMNRGELAAKLGVDAKKLTFLLMGGAYGVLGEAKWLLKTLGDIEPPIQILIVCGKDEKLYRSLDGLVAEAKNRVIRFRFVHNVEELMGVSDIIITKAGGLTVSEALTRRLPMIIYRPIPGQEEENAMFLQDIGAGYIAIDEGELAGTLKKMITCPEELEKMRKAAGGALPGNAAETAVEHMLAIIKHKITTREMTG